MQTKIFRSISSNEITCCFCKGTDVEENYRAVNFTCFQHRNIGQSCQKTDKNMDWNGKVP